MLKFLRKMKSKAKYVALAAVSAISCVALTAFAGAEELTSNAPTMSDTISTAGNTLTSQLGDLVTAVIPVLMSAVGVALIIFGVLWIIRTVKKIFTKTSNG